MSLRIYNPEIFQGNLKKNNYFEGWYFKHVSKDLQHVYSFIPGISLADESHHSFIQVINGITGETEYITYPLNQFIWDKNRLYVKIGNSVFTENFISLDIKGKVFNVFGHLDYSNNVSYPKSFFSPGIMGWYSFVPFMECKHCIVSANHDVTGVITANDNLVNMDGAKGYIEKDLGTSFPESWIWIQSNSFSNPGTSFNFSIAKIPWLGNFFVGFIAFLYYNRKFYLFSTYNHAELLEINHDENSIDIVLRNQYSILKIKAVKNTFGDLIAPVSGSMSRRIKESLDSDVFVELFDKKYNLLYSDSGKRAGLEIIEKIFDLLKK
jgi:tocopherol cyclase